MAFEEYLQERLDKDGAPGEYYQFLKSIKNDAYLYKIIENWHKSELSKRGTQGGKARHEKLSPERRKEIARMGGLAKRAVAVWLKK